MLYAVRLKRSKNFVGKENFFRGKIDKSEKENHHRLEDGKIMYFVSFSFVIFPVEGKM